MGNAWATQTHYGNRRARDRMTSLERMLKRRFLHVLTKTVIVGTYTTKLRRDTPRTAQTRAVSVLNTQNAATLRWCSLRLSAIRSMILHGLFSDSTCRCVSFATQKPALMPRA
eukprot:TRINITY_DN658_c0_g1_i3.p1 TRINITY_DN658_c0_g1~~TRINITY_DN658_c0_g1_i3.p1  ORF type:complete len:113 (-),score=12.39 TRINITY_DN658_c0_g1_i3:568-906(-)